MIRLTNTQEIALYPWMHTDEERENAVRRMGELLGVSGGVLNSTVPLGEALRPRR